MSALSTANERAIAPPEQLGFTLFEMLVAIAVLALGTGVIFPALDRAIARQEFSLAAARVEFAARQARAGAVRRSETVRLPDAGLADLPPRMRLEMPRGGLSFYPDGTSNGGVVVLGDGARSFRLVVDADTGAVKAGS